MRYSPITRLLDPDQLQRDIAAEEAKAAAAKKATPDRGPASRSTTKKKKPSKKKAAPEKQPLSTLLQRLNARHTPPGGWDEKDKVGRANRPGEPGNGARESIPQSSTLTPDSSILTPEPTISADPCPSVAEKPTTPPSSLLNPHSSILTPGPATPEQIATSEAAKALFSGRDGVLPSKQEHEARIEQLKSENPGARLCEPQPSSLNPEPSPLKPWQRALKARRKITITEAR